MKEGCKERAGQEETEGQEAGGTGEGWGSGCRRVGFPGEAQRLPSIHRPWWARPCWPGRHHDIRGADLSLVTVLRRRTPRRMATSMSSAGGSMEAAGGGAGVS